MIRAVLFDNGGVLTEGGTRGSTHAIFAKMYKNYQHNDQFKALLLRLFKGTIETDDFFNQLNVLFPGNGNPDKNVFLSNASAPFVRSTPVHKLAADLRKAGIRTGIVSNVTDMVARKHEQAGDYAEFDPVILSCDEKVAKPEPAFYERALSRLGLTADQVLFIDDRAESLVPAARLGMKTIHALSPEQIVKDTSKLVNLENNLNLPSVY